MFEGQRRWINIKEDKPLTTNVSLINKPVSNHIKAQKCSLQYIHPYWTSTKAHVAKKKRRKFILSGSLKIISLLKTVNGPPNT